MEIAVLSAHWAKRSLNFIRKDTEALAKSIDVCPRIRASLTSPSEDLRLVRLSRVAATARPIIAALNRTVFGVFSGLCTPAGSYAAKIGRRQSTSSKEMVDLELFFAAGIIGFPLRSRCNYLWQHIKPFGQDRISAANNKFSLACVNP